jgi:hypothetical protein
MISLVLSACSEPPAPPAPVASHAPAAVATTSASASSSAEKPAETAKIGGRGDGSGGGQKGQRFGEAAVYVDGKPIAVMRYLELPPTFSSIAYPLEDGRKVKRWSLADYLETLGVDLKKATAVHLLGGRGRASMMTAAEVLKHRKDLFFSFTRGEGGKARVHYPADGIETNTTIDTIQSVAVYVDKPAPEFVREKRHFLYADGSIVVGVPYSKPEESLRGTRVYADGKLVGSVKRRRLPDSVLSKRYELQRPLYSVDAYLSSVGVPPAQLREIAFVRGDSVGARFDAAAWKKLEETADFSLQQGSEGRLILHTTTPSGETAIPVSAVLCFVKQQPPKALLEAPVDPSSDGSQEPQPAPEPEGQ